MRLIERIRSATRRSGSTRTVTRSHRHRPLLEGLEDRALMTIVFTPQNGAETVQDYGGPKLSTSGPGTPIYLIFWGSYWSTTAGQAQAAADMNAVNPVLYNSALLDGIQEYGTTYRAFQPSGTWAVFDYSNPGSTFTDAQIRGEVAFGISSLGLPDSNVFSNSGIYYVITPPGATSSTYPSAGGYHGPDVVNNPTHTRYYGWLGNFGSTDAAKIDNFTYVLAHETMESFTDPEVNLHSAIIVTNINGEVADGEAQNYTALLNGYLVQSYWSAARQAYVITDGNSQTVTVNNGNLTINGTGASDTFTVDVNSRGGVQVSVDGQYFSFDSGRISSITLNTDGAGSTVNVYNTSAAAPLTIYGHATDTVNVGNASNGVRGINGNVTVNNPPSFTTLNIDDGADPIARTAFVDKSGINGYLIGMAPAVIYWNTNDIASVNIKSGYGADTIGIVRNTEVLALDSSGGADSVNIGAGGHLGEITGGITIRNTPSFTTLNVDGSADSGAQNVSLYNNVASEGTFGQIVGLAPATIQYKVNDTTSITIQTGTGTATVGVASISRATNVIGHSNSTTINVGIGGSVQGIAATLTLTNPPAHSVLNVDDSADATGRSVSFSTYTAGDGLYGQIIGLAPGVIQYKEADMYAPITVKTGSGASTLDVASTTYQGLDLTAGSGNDSVTIRSTSGPVNFNGNGGTDLVSVGDAGSVQGILGAVTLINPPAYNTIIVDDSADPTGRAVTFDNYTDGMGFFFGTIVGLAPAAISYKPGDTSFSGITVNTGYGADAINLANPAYRGILLNTNGGDDSVTIGTLTGSVTYDAGPGVNSLVGPSTGASWTISGANAGTVSFLSFSSVGTLVGGVGPDSFALAAGATLTGSIDGGGGSDTLIGTNVGNTWNITANDGGNLNGTLPFTHVENLTGGSANDRFKFSAGKHLSGIIDGMGGTNALDFTLYTSTVTVNLATNTSPGGGFVNIKTLYGGTSNADKIIGSDAANVWIVTGANTGTVGPNAFFSFENLFGGASSDTFKLYEGGSLSGTVIGNGGLFDKLDYSPRTTPVTLNYATQKATSIGGLFAGLELIIGSGSTADTLYGRNVDNNWTITSQDAGSLNSVLYIGFENLIGGAGRDVFKSLDGMGITGTIDGGGGFDWLDDRNYTTAITVNFSTGMATNIGALANIEGVRAGSGGSTLTGNAGTNNILIGGAGSDIIHGGLSRSLLIGGKGADTVVGGSDSDVVVGDFTIYDGNYFANYVALEAILAEWTSANSYAVRVAHLRSGGGLNGAYMLTYGTTVKSDSAVDQSTGSAGQDWFLKSPNDVITDLAINELVN